MISLRWYRGIRLKPNTSLAAALARDGGEPITVEEFERLAETKPKLGKA